MEYRTAYIPHILEGQVVETDDSQQMGSVRIWIPSLDGENFDIDSLPWAEYAPPLFGFTVNYPRGVTGGANKAHAAYGIWATPKLGATVLVACVEGNPAKRVYFASTLRLHRNRSLPAGRNTDFLGNKGPFGDAGSGDGTLDPLEPASSNLKIQFGSKTTAPEAISRGVYERQVAQHKDVKDGTDGYAPNPANPSALDSQTSCWTTPAGHSIIFQDNPENCRLRVKTAEGSQIILDDANERIYISTARGRSWTEMDFDGNVHHFAAESLNIRAGKDINLSADGDINLESKKNINIKADGGTLKLSSGDDMHIKSFKSILANGCTGLQLSSEKSLNISAETTVDILATTDLVMSGKTTDINGGGLLTLFAASLSLMATPAKLALPASCPKIADSAKIVPGSEPWTRPTSPYKRGTYWKK